MKVSFYILLPHRSVKWIAFHCTFLLYFRGTFMKPVSETFFCSFFFRTFAHEFLYKTLIIFLTSTSGFYTKKTFVICIQNSILLNLCFLDACSNDILCGLIFILSTFHILYQHSRFMSISWWNNISSHAHRHTLSLTCTHALSFTCAVSHTHASHTHSLSHTHTHTHTHHNQVY
jgi:hypothetical protein